MNNFQLMLITLVLSAIPYAANADINSQLVDDFNRIYNGEANITFDNIKDEKNLLTIRQRAGACMAIDIQLENQIEIPALIEKRELNENETKYVSTIKLFKKAYGQSILATIALSNDSAEKAVETYKAATNDLVSTMNKSPRVNHLHKFDTLGELSRVCHEEFSRFVLMIKNAKAEQYKYH